MKTRKIEHKIKDGQLYNRIVKYLMGQLFTRLIARNY